MQFETRREILDLAIGVHRMVEDANRAVWSVAPRRVLRSRVGSGAGWFSSGVLFEDDHPLLVRPLMAVGGASIRSGTGAGPRAASDRSIIEIWQNKRGRWAWSTEASENQA